MYNQFTLWSCTNFMFKAYYSHPVLTFLCTFMKRCFIWEENKIWFSDCWQKIVLLFLSHFSIRSLDLFQITLNLIWKGVIRVCVMYKAPWQYLVWYMYASVTLKKIYWQCILGSYQISCGSLTGGSQLFYSLTTHLDLCFSTAAKWWASQNKFLMWIGCVKIPLFCL